MKTKEELLDWLRDAHAMETAMTIALQKQCQNDQAPLALREVLASHLNETERHAELVEQCLRDLGSETSTLKDAAANSMEWMKGAASKLARDEVIKDMLASCGEEHFEIACYTALKVAGQQLGLLEVITTADTILEDEYRMAAWLDKHIPDTIRDYLSGQIDNLPGTVGDPNAAG
ncbi:MAG: ferritin-like domain protein [Prosthecobacter sp.]|nr:ferritin-like domain protein [Prosthecobacter sp.]